MMRSIQEGLCRRQNVTKMKKWSAIGGHESIASSLNSHNADCRNITDKTETDEHSFERMMKWFELKENFVFNGARSRQLDVPQNNSLYSIEARFTSEKHRTVVISP